MRPIHHPVVALLALVVASTAGCGGSSAPGTPPGSNGASSPGTAVAGASSPPSPDRSASAAASPSAAGTDAAGAPTPTAAATPAASAALSPDVFVDASSAINGVDLSGTRKLRLGNVAGSDDAVWFVAKDNVGARAVLIRLDVKTRSVSRLPVPYSSGLAIGSTSVWSLFYKGANGLVRADRSGRGRAETIPLEMDAVPRSIAVDDEDRLWVADEDGTNLVSPSGEVIRSFRSPFKSRRDLGYDATIEGAPAFGTLWAYDSAEATIHRIDADDGTVTARIELSDCPPIEHHRNYPGHRPLVYPLVGVEGMSDAMVASCPMDLGHLYPGPMNVIDPATNKVVTQVDVGPGYGRGFVLDGQWWVPIVESMPEQAEGDGTGLLVRIDPRTGRIASTAAVSSPILPSRPDASAVVAADVLWILLATWSEDRGDVRADVLRITPEELWRARR